MLLAGVLIGQLNITISPNVKSVFFLMFLFAVGYGVGPQFVRGLKSDGVPQAIFACVLCVAVLLSTFVVAKLAGYNAGLAAGLLSGAATISAVLGVATDTINGLGLPPEEAKAWIDSMPVAYAVTYLFGTAGSAWFLASIGPKLLGVNLEKECKQYEAKMGGLPRGPAGVVSGYQRFALRAYRVAASSKFVGQTVADLEAAFAPGSHLRRSRSAAAARIVEAEPDTVIQIGDVLAVAAAARGAAGEGGRPRPRGGRSRAAGFPGWRSSTSSSPARRSPARRCSRSPTTERGRRAAACFCAS